MDKMAFIYVYDDNILVDDINRLGKWQHCGWKVQCYIECICQ